MEGPAISTRPALRGVTAFPAFPAHDESRLGCRRFGSTTRQRSGFDGCTNSRMSRESSNSNSACRPEQGCVRDYALQVRSAQTKSLLGSGQSSSHMTPYRKMRFPSGT
jgi:hypothetical protein